MKSMKSIATVPPRKKAGLLGFYTFMGLGRSGPSSLYFSPPVGYDFRNSGYKDASSIPQFRHNPSFKQYHGVRAPSILRGAGGVG